MVETTTTNGRPSTTLFGRNAAGIGIRRTTTTSAAGRSIRQFTDDQGLMVRLETPSLHPTYFSYDSAGRILQTAQGNAGDCANPAITTSAPDCRRTTQAYFGDEVPSLKGYLKEVIDLTNVTTSYFRDPLGRTLLETRSNVQTQFGWDANSNLASVTPPGKSTHGMTYTPLNFLESYNPPAAGFAQRERRLYNEC